MASLRKNNKQVNSIRTTLLLLANKELTFIKKTNNTKINSKEITEVEKYYNSGNEYIVKLKEENFISNSMARDIIQNKNIKNNFSFKSPDIQNNNFVRKIRNSNKNNPIINLREKGNIRSENKNKSNSQYEIKLYGVKSDISSKKNEYFKLKTLKINKEEMPLLRKILYNSIYILLFMFSLLIKTFNFILKNFYH